MLRESALHQEKKKKAAFWKCCRPSEGECGLCMFHKILKITAYAPHSVLSSLQAGVKVELGCTRRKWTSLPFFLLLLPTFSTASNYNHSISRTQQRLMRTTRGKGVGGGGGGGHVMDAGCKELGTSSSILGKTWKAANFRHRYRKDLENVVHITLANAETERVSVGLLAGTPSSAYSLACGFDGLDQGISHCSWRHFFPCIFFSS